MKSNIPKSEMIRRKKFLYPVVGVFLLVEAVALFFYLQARAAYVEPVSLNPKDPGEKVLRFDTELRIQKDGTIRVHEDISVRCEGKQVKKGIYRALPTSSTDETKEAISYSYKFQGVTFDGEPLPLTVNNNQGFEVLQIRNEDLQLGDRVFGIDYEMKGGIKTLADYDELRFSQSGIWAFPVLQASAIIYLPPFLLAESVVPLGYTGTFQEQSKHFKTKIDVANNAVMYWTTKPLVPGQYFEIRLRMPKGFIKTKVDS